MLDKHCIGDVAICLKYCKPPSTVKIVLIDRKKKRGRSPKAKPALLISAVIRFSYSILYFMDKTYFSANKICIIY
jgi:hypothetical protein